jgi:hypothetical protein
MGVVWQVWTTHFFAAPASLVAPHSLSVRQS